MHPRIPKRAALAAPLATVLALLAPTASHAYDEAASLPPSAPVPLTALPKSPALDLSSLKINKPAKVADDDAFREKDVWGRIRSGYAIPDLNNDLVAKHTKWYTARPDHMAITTGRASRYLFHVCLLYTSPSPRDATLSRMPSSA